MKDSLAMACSGLCIGHCLLTPVILTMGGAGFLGTFLASEVLHKALLIPVLCLAIASLPFSFRRHFNWYPLCLGVVGSALLIASVNVSAPLELYLSLSGAALLIMAHLFNRNSLLRVRDEGIRGRTSEV